jgi:acetyl-CoA carboxylase biotin carboxyl carrier protein
MSDAKKKTDIDADLIRELAALLEETGLSEIEYGAKDWHLRVARSSAPATTTIPETSPTPSTTGGEAEDADTAHPGLVTSPMVGLVYTGPDPDSPPFCKVGDQVAQDDPLLLIEAMKVFNQIKAPKGGTISRIFVSNGSPVEYGEPLMIIE